MIYLVTGGAGFIGSHLVEALLKKEGAVVVSLDDYSTGCEENHIPGARYIRGSTKDIASLVEVKPDVVFHLGEYARTEKSFEDLARVWESNKNGTFAVLEFCRAHGCKLVYAGSSTKFADDGLGRDQSPYAWTKATNTELVRNYGQWFGLPYAITYFHNVYGPRELSGPFGTLIAIFIENCLKGEPLRVRAPGSQRRNFTHVNDIVAGLVAVGDRGMGDGYGLGADESYSVMEIAEMFGGPIEMVPDRQGNRKSSHVDATRAKEEFGWEATHHIASYIRDIVAKQRT